jgi:tetratricopeptide (TPR) repeat protein
MEPKPAEFVSDRPGTRRGRARAGLRVLWAVFFIGRAAMTHAAGPGPEAFDRLAETGLEALYNLDYARARTAFEALTREYPSRSIGSYAISTLLWWELTNEFDERHPALEKSFLNSADQTIAQAKENIKRGDPTGEEHLALGGALGLKSRWEAIQGHWFKAYIHGKQAYKAQKAAMELNPSLYDAYLGVGIFNYYTATLPSAIRVLAKLVRIRGDKALGLSQIRLAMEKGQFARTAAQLFLVGIYNNVEKDYDKALALVRQGRERFPQSSLFHFLEILTLENRKEWDAMRREAGDYIARVHRGEPSYRKAYLHRGYFLLGNSFLGERRPEDALRLYDKVIREFESEDRWVSLAYLNRGKAYDALGERDKALADYRAVLKRRDVWGLHDQAEAFKKRPYALDGSKATAAGS